MTFELPDQTIVNKVIPKNAFDTYTTAKQKKKLAEYVERIRWMNKLSSDTLNLSGKEITEIQVFEVELRKQEDIEDILNVFDKAIPYPILFVVFYKQKMYLRTSKKHMHPTQDNISVIDWVFKSEWQNRAEVNCSFDLKKNLDYVFQNICNQLSSGYSKADSIEELVMFEHKFEHLKKSIFNLKATINNTNQFNKKVELNQTLKSLERELIELKNRKS